MNLASGRRGTVNCERCGSQALGNVAPLPSLLQSLPPIVGISRFLLRLHDRAVVDASTAPMAEPLPADAPLGGGGEEGLVGSSPNAANFCSFRDSTLSRVGDMYVEAKVGEWLVFGPQLANFVLERGRCVRRLRKRLKPTICAPTASIKYTVCKYQV